MKKLYEDLWLDLENLPHANYTTYHLFKDIPLNPNITTKTIRKYGIKQGDFKDEWKYIMLLNNFLKASNFYLSKLDWTSKRPGTFLIKGLNLLQGKICSYFRKPAATLLKNLFKLPNQKDVSMQELVFLHSASDYRILTENTSRPTHGPKSLIDIDSQFIDCFKFISDNRTTSLFEVENHFEDEDQNMILEKSPCLGKEIPPLCENYCKWHQETQEIISRKYFINTMKYGLPQRKLILDDDVYNEWEKSLANKIFGINSTREIPYQVASASPVVFCYGKGKGFIGDDIGMYAKICNDFFITPSDIGMSLTKNLDIKGLVEISEEYEDIFEPDSNERRPASNINGGSLWSELILVLDTGPMTFLDQTYQTDNTVDSTTIQLQIHQPKEFANMILESNFDDKSEPITLRRGYEYFYDLYPYGQTSSNEFKTLTYNQRGCKLETEVGVTSIFKTYTEKNCKYSCLVKLASQKCSCRPWDYLDNSQEKECDVFGRICFLNAIKLMTKSPKEMCNECPKECDFIKYKKTLRQRKLLAIGGSQGGTYFKIKNGKPEGFKAFIDFIMDENKTLIDAGLRNVLDTTFSNKYGEEYQNKKHEELVIIHLTFKQPEINIISPKYSAFDMIGTFGGQLGILEKLTGASLLGFINLMLLMFKLAFSFCKHH